MEKQCYTKDSKVFNDPIHGHILLHPILVKIINTPEFQRLRNIKQLGGVYFVYPGASHNRFEHSIGVVHLAGELAKALKVKQLEQKNPLESLISDEDILCVQIAGPCHDLGHGPFSHLFDRMFMPEAIKRCEKEKEGKAAKEDKVDEKDNGKNQMWEHEDASIKMLRRLLDKTDGLKDMMKKRGLKIEEGETDWKFIEELIKGLKEDQAQHEWTYKGRDEKKSFLYEIVSNKETGIDVDKFDYFARDCHHLDIQNNFDHQRFIMFARVCDVNGRKHICSRDKEVANLYDIFQQRHSIHRRACKHRMVLAVEIMIKDALVLADQAEHKDPQLQIKGSDDKTYCLCKAKEDMEAYVKLTDQVTERILYFPPSSIEGEMEDSTEPTSKEAREDARKNLEKARKIVHRVMIRDMYYCVGQAMRKDQVEISEEMMGSLKKMVKDIPKDGEDEFVIIAVPLDYGKENSGSMSEPFIYHRHNPDKAPSTSEKRDQLEISEELMERFKKMVKDIPEDGEDEFVIIVVPLDYGKEGQDSKPYVYRKKDHAKGISISESELKENNEKKMEKMKEIEEDLRGKLVGLPGGKFDGEDNFEVMFVTLDYGKKNVDPISKAYFYRKDNPDKGIPIFKSKVSKFLPEHFSEDKLMVYWKNLEGLKGDGKKRKEEDHKKFFRDWCKENGFEDVEEDNVQL